MICIAQKTNPGKKKKKERKKLKELIKEPTMKFSGYFLVFSETPLVSLKDHT
jgi:hypothetical protein